MNDNSIDGLLGREYTGVKGQAAIVKLMEEKQGHVKAAFFREDVGTIDLIWGNSMVGLQHIIERRGEDGIDINSFMSDLTNVIENGIMRGKNKRGNFEILLDGKMAVISPEFHCQGITFLLTAFKTRLKK